MNITKCPLFCRYLVIGDYGYKCRRYRMGLRETEAGEPTRLTECEKDGVIKCRKD